MAAATAQREMPRDEVFRAGEESLAAAYSTDFLRVAEFYSPTDWRSLEGLLAGVPRALEWGPAEGTRIPLASILTRYHKALGAPKASLKGAALLGDSRSVAIVTGQQPGLAGGPLMLLHKVANAVRLAEVLNQSGVMAVPVFWAASEDHDIAEVNQFSAVDANGKLRTARLEMFRNVTSTPLEELRFDANDPGWARVEAMVREGARGVGDSRLAKQTDALLKLAKRHGFGRACNRLLLALFGHRGLVVVEPKLLRKLNGAHAVIERELGAAPPKSRSELMAPRKKLTEAGFRLTLEEPQDALFWLIVKGKRHRVSMVQGKFKADCFAKPRTKAQMLVMLDKHPLRFSSGARLRPVMQGACLPVLAYIGGPSEIAYHGELCDLFKWHGIPMPALLPRWSGVLAEPGSSPAAIRTQVTDGSEAASRASAAVSEFLNESRSVLGTLEQALGPVAPTVAADVAQISGRAEKTLRELMGRIGADPLRELGVTAEVRASAARQYPGGVPQERVANWLAMWPVWGEALQNWWENRSPFALGVGEVRLLGEAKATT